MRVDDIGILIILRTMNRLIFEKKLPLFYIVDVERGHDDAAGEYCNVKSKIYNNENFKWEEHDSTLLLSEMEPYIDDIEPFLETWIDLLYDKLVKHMWIANRNKKKG